jgi:hypothetical protein
MNPSDPDADPFTEALRLDLPSAKDATRVRARLVGAGVLAGAGTVVPGLAAATSGGLLAKLGALPMAAKLGASAILLGVAALPVLPRTSQNLESGKSEAAPARTAAIPPATPRLAPAAKAQTSEPKSPTVITRQAAATGEARATPRSTSGSLQAPVSPATPAFAPTSAVGSFPVAEEPFDEGTLRAETALMERALAALELNDFDTARRELAAHAARFPNGHLKPERESALGRMLAKETKP